MTGETKNIVLVHGGFADGSGWRGVYDVLKRDGYDVVGISPDTPEKLARFVEKEALTYPLLSDVDKGVLDAYGAFGEKKLYGKTTVGVIRSTVVVGPEGTVALAKYNVKATGHVAALRTALAV